MGLEAKPRQHKCVRGAISHPHSGGHPVIVVVVVGNIYQNSSMQEIERLEWYIPRFQASVY